MAALLERLLTGELAAVRVAPDGQQSLEPRQGLVLVAGSFNPVHEGHWGLARATRELLQAEPIFELSISNADKPALTREELEHRLRSFAWKAAIWVTRAPTFLEKAALFPGAVFVVGADTAERILAPRYYGGEAGLEAALQLLQQRGCRFLVAGRQLPNRHWLEVGNLTIPADHGRLFQPIPATVFRLNISSTELRRQQQQRIPDGPATEKAPAHR